ncbi:MAG: hypothetical protein WB586_09155 [Chthoniobacterales bacterium]
MRIPILFALLIGLVCGTCATALGWSAAPFGPNDYAFMAARPYYQEVSRGQKRFYNFLRRANKNQQMTLAKTPYVAIESYTLSAGEVPGLIWKMALGRIPARGPYGTDPPHDPASIQVEFLLIFDQRTGQLAAPEGVLVINPPVPGTIGQFGGVQAVYAGTGWW